MKDQLTIPAVVDAAKAASAHLRYRAAMLQTFANATAPIAQIEPMATRALPLGEV